MPDCERYVPGVCNIGAKEVAKRRAVGWIALAACVVLEGAFIVFKTAAAWRLVLFVPAMFSALGFLQAARRFCVMYGLGGEHKIRSGGKRGLVEEVEDRRRDRNASLWIVGYSVLIAAAVATAAYCVA